VCEAHKRVHEGELPRVIELEARDALSRRGDRWFRELSQLPAIDKEPFASVPNQKFASE
jgi:hypothetical protein